MTYEDFNLKWKDHLEKGHYGMAINHEPVIKYMDEEFEKEINYNKDFEFSQIKTKFNFSRVYSTSVNNHLWEKKINELLKE